jgi:hypothetical protein
MAIGKGQANLGEVLVYRGVRLTSFQRACRFKVLRLQLPGGKVILARHEAEEDYSRVVQQSATLA